MNVSSRMRVVVLLGCGFALNVCTSGAVPAAGENETEVHADANLSADDDAFLNRQASEILREVSQTIQEVRPAFPESRERLLMLRLLDAVLHDPVAPARPPIQQFFHSRMAAAAQELESGHVERGATIWKLYNHGFVVRTPSVTLAFDLHPGASGFRATDRDGKRTLVACPGFPATDELMKRIVAQCDVLFISHQHPDHASKPVAELFISEGKPVVAPEPVFAGTALHEKITHLKREAHSVQVLPVRGGTKELKVVVYPGQQYQDGGVPNNVVLVYSPEGMSFAHNGDQINDPYPEYQKDYAWIDHVREFHKVDVYMTNCWTNDVLRDVRGFDPRLVLPGHENELSHPLWDRVPYWGDSEFLHLSYPQLKTSGYPIVVMTWGESYHYEPEPGRPNPQ